MNLSVFHGKSALFILLGSLAFCFVSVSLVQAWNDDSGILKWNPTWFSAYRYSPVPLGHRGRSFMFKRWASEAPFGFRFTPGFLYTPFSQSYDGRKRKISIAEELNLPVNRNRVLGWYNGPGSTYDLAKSESDEAGDEENAL